LIIGILLWAALILLVIGIFAPILTLTKFLFFENRFSIYTGLIQLFKDRQFFLFVVILVFSICFPAGKIFLQAYLWHGKDLPVSRRQKLFGWLDTLGKWSMLDVFVVALLVVTIKLNIIADVEVHFGIYVFAASIFLSMIASRFMKRTLPGNQGTNLNCS
jgi:paraquat-inducible protein A